MHRAFLAAHLERGQALFEPVSTTLDTVHFFL